MTLTELQTQMPGLNEDIRTYLNRKVIFYKVPMFGEPFIDDENAAKAIRIFNEDLLRESQREQIKKEEAERRKEEEKRRRAEIEAARKRHEAEIKAEKKRQEFAKSFNEFYEYDVVTIINENHGAVDKERMMRVLADHAAKGWRLHTIYSNELGKNALSVMGLGMNSTASEDVLIFERRVEKA